MKESEFNNIISNLEEVDIKDQTKSGRIDKSFTNQIKQNLQDVSEAQKHQFNLGNGMNFTDPIQAAEYLLEREYGDSFLFNDSKDEPIFIPPVFLSQEYSKKTKVSVLDYNVKEKILDTLGKVELPENWKTKEYKDLLNMLNSGADNFKVAYDKWIRQMKPIYNAAEELKSNSNLKWLIEAKPTDIGGEQIEHWFFDQINSQEMKEILKDCVILISLTIKTNLEKKKNFHREFDFLIISWQLKLIIGIEVKRAASKEILNKAIEQLEKCHDFLEVGFGDILSQQKWSFYPVIFAGQSEFVSPSNHFISMKSDLKKWLKDLFNGKENVLNSPPSKRKKENPSTSSSQTEKEILKKLLQIMVFTIHISRKDLKAPITTTNWVQYVTDAITSVSTADNIIFYSNNQLPILISNDYRYRKIIIHGKWGTGKSFLLQEKGKILAKQPEYQNRVMYIVDSGRKTLFYESIKYHLEPLGITVMHFRGMRPFSSCKNKVTEDSNKKPDLVRNQF